LGELPLEQFERLVLYAVDGHVSTVPGSPLPAVSSAVSSVTPMLAASAERTDRSVAGDASAPTGRITTSATSPTKGCPTTAERSPSRSACAEAVADGVPTTSPTSATSPLKRIDAPASGDHATSTTVHSVAVGIL